ncbi:hypothetical protein CPB83DRAFT_849674 [Crepidotus variabilis]|uniref:DUF6699 domain-containing protein n=1 Tax=Crepidotus variabilis TaxID=179855 RepID=A0A9P6JRW0_9AGAR|nr:hypothetical protein CPB83DRAFT_849674 [Crepidotus variabilis]
MDPKSSLLFAPYVADSPAEASSNYAIPHLGRPEATITRPSIYQGHWNSLLPPPESSHLSQQPPPLQAQKYIPLPPLCDQVVHLHPLLLHYRDTTPIFYNLTLPPSTATAPSVEGRPDYWEWKTHAAMDPAIAPSLTIRLEQTSSVLLERPIVVLPTATGASSITVQDVLQAVHRTLYEVADGRTYFDTFSLGSRHIRTSSSPQERIGLILQKKPWWKGLYASDVERDVWILRTEQN